ncbi:glycosyltransferase, partial [Enterococcus lactis]
MKKSLVAITSIFPYGKSEPYFSEELNYLSKIQNLKIILFSLSPRVDDEKKDIPDNVELNTIFFKGYLFYLVYSFSLLINTELYKELFRLIRRRKFTKKKFVKLITYLSRSHYEYNRIKKILKAEYRFSNDSEILFYSYRLEYQAYILKLLKKEFPKCKFIARAHRYDLYEEHSKAGYLPFQREIIESLDDVITISNDGYHYLKSKYPTAKNISLRYLGTKNYLNVKNWSTNREKMRVVSCSNITSVKRVELIARSLKAIPKSYLVEWVHYGVGNDTDMNKIRKELDGMPCNIKCIFPGHIDNKELMVKYQKEVFHVFINVSTSEGIPVSIMEALSFGVPVIATNVGGTSEIISDGYNGYLLESDFSTDKLANLLCEVKEMEEHKYNTLRCNSRKIWEEKFS